MKATQVLKIFAGAAVLAIQVSCTDSAANTVVKSSEDTKIQTQENATDERLDFERRRIATEKDRNCRKVDGEMICEKKQHELLHKQMSSPEVYRDQNREKAF